MGKGTDKLYITHSEWTNQVAPGGMKFGGVSQRPVNSNAFQPLSFNCCALNLQPFKTPMCSPDGYIFDMTSIVPWLRTHKNTHPITGGRLQFSDLIPLHFHRLPSTNEFHCPVMFKVFTPSTKIVAIRPTGNVYSYKAYYNLNVKPNHFFDLLQDDVPFDADKDVIILQDPQDINRKNVKAFYWYQESGMKLEVERQERLRRREKRQRTRLEERVLEELANTEVQKVPASADAATGESSVSRGLTSTCAPPVTARIKEPPDSNPYTWVRTLPPEKAMSYVSLTFKNGTINLELYTQAAPEAIHSFIKALLGEDGHVYGKRTETWLNLHMAEYSGYRKWDVQAEKGVVERGTVTAVAAEPGVFKVHYLPTQTSYGYLVVGKVVGGDSVTNLVSGKVKEAQVYVNPFQKYERARRKKRKQADP